MIAITENPVSHGTDDTTTAKPRCMVSYKSAAHGVLLEHVLQGVCACMSACVHACGRARMRAREGSHSLMGGRAHAHTHELDASFHDAVPVQRWECLLP